MLQKIILLSLILILNGCFSDDEYLLCNSQDPQSYCYLPAPGSNIYSYSPYEIIVTDNLINEDDPQINNAESLQISRLSDSLFDSIYIVPIIDKTFQFIDSATINDSYQYEMAYINFDNETSETSQTDTLIHMFKGVDNFSLNLINENELNLNWQYNYSEHFIGPIPDSIDFKILKINQSTNFETINLTLPVSDSLSYQYIDNQIQIGDILQYDIEVKYEDLLSDKATTEIVEINFPTCFITNWIPLSSYQIYLEWECTDVINDNLPRIKLSNQYLDENQYLFNIENSNGQGFFVDDLSQYLSNIDESIAGEIINYNLEWEGTSGQSLNADFELQTFPINNMIYIPSLNQFSFGQEEAVIINNTKSFYIDKYEVTESQINNPSSNPYEKWDSFTPENGVSYNQALEFCNSRTNAFSGLVNPGSNENNIIEFILPNEVDWEIAASAKYQDIQLYGLTFNDETYSANFVDKYNYTVSVGNGQINCNYANIASCFNGPLKIGSFNGDSPEFQESISPSGLYDCSGNVYEWVRKSDLINHNQEEQREILRGGSYSSNANESSNTSFIYEYPEINHNSFGFRTIIYADEYLEFLRSTYDQK